MFQMNNFVFVKLGFRQIVLCEDSAKSTNHQPLSLSLGLVNLIYRTCFPDLSIPSVIFGDKHN